MRNKQEMAEAKARLIRAVQADPELELSQLKERFQMDHHDIHRTLAAVGLRAAPAANNLSWRRKRRPALRRSIP